MDSPQKPVAIQSVLVFLAWAVLCLCLVPLASSAQTPQSVQSGTTEEPDSGYSLDARPEDDYLLYDSRLIGYWEHRDSHGTISLEIVSEDRMIIAGRVLRYYILPGVLHVMDEYGEFEYFYELQNDRLVLTLEEDGGHPLIVGFRRVNLSEAPAHETVTRSME